MTADFVLAVDLDGVCCDYTAAIRPHVEHYTGKPLPTAGPDDWDFASWGVPDHTAFLSIHSRAVDAGIFRTAQAISGASDILWALSDLGVRIRIVTHRLLISGAHGQVVADTADWLELHDIPYRDLLFLEDKASVDAHLFIDDAPHNILALQAAGKRTLTFAQPYNKKTPGNRATDWPAVWQAVYEQVTDLERMTV